MNPPNLASVEIKAFVPAKDFELSMKFYQALGFTRASVSEGIAYFHCGNSSFLLQDFFVREHADNFQMHWLVESVDDWHKKAKEVAEPCSTSKLENLKIAHGQCEISRTLIQAVSCGASRKIFQI